MKTRKIILLAAIAVLAFAFVIQIIASPSGSVKTVEMTDKPDSIVIEKGGSSLLLAKQGDAWVVGEERYAADPDKVDSIVRAASAIKVYETLSKGGDETRFGFGEKGTTLIAKLGDKELRRIEVGKASSTARQSYVRLDGKKDILLVSGNLAQGFGMGEGELRDKRVLDLAAGDIISVSVRGEANYDLVKEGDPAAWKVSSSATGQKADPAKIDSWLAGIAKLRAQDFAPAGAAPAGKPFGSLTLKIGSREASLTVLSKADDSKYLCVSSENPYRFYLSTYDVQRYLKPLSDLVAK